MTGMVTLAVSLALSAGNSVKAESANSDLNLRINSVVSLSITNCDGSNADNITISVDPTTSGVFKSACQNISVAANTPGYNLLVKSSSTDLIYQNPTTITPAPIVPSTPSYNPAVLPNDTWGFAIERQDGISWPFDTAYTIDNANNKYIQLRTGDNFSIYYTDKAFGETPAPLSTFRTFFGAKLTLATIAGQYKTTITYTAIGAYVPCAWDDEISFEDPRCVPTTLQNFTTAECAALEIYTNNNDDNKLLVLTDIRDGKEYLVGKLADGNCWMLNNLKLGAPTDSLDDIRYINMNPANTNTDGYPWFYPVNNYDGAFTWPSVFALVSGQTGFDATKPNSEETDIYSPNFAGYYYNWCAAVMGEELRLEDVCTRSNVMPTDAVYDICPAGWRLPKGSESMDDPDNEFFKLAFNMAGYADYDEWTNGPTAEYEELIDGFLHTGAFRGVFAGYSSSSQWAEQGGFSGFWSAQHSPSSTYNALGLYLYNNDGYYSDINVYNGSRNVGVSVRCLLKS
jgi:uncharacterized protein (TIGR02145 family)